MDLAAGRAARGTALGLVIWGLVLLRRGWPDEALACTAQTRQALGHQSLADRNVLGTIEVVEASVALARLDLAELAANQVDTLGECLRALKQLGAQPQLDQARCLLWRLGQCPRRPGHGGLAGSTFGAAGQEI